MIRIAFIVFMITASLLFGAEAAFVKYNSPLFETEEREKSLGVLIVSSEVEILEIKNDISKVAFIGYLPEGSTVAYEKAGVLMVGLEDIVKPEELEVIGEVVDEYDTVWIEVKATGFIESAALVKSREELISSAEELFGERCGACHALYHKSEFDPNVWPSILDSMSGQSGLTKDQKDLIVKFLQDQEKD